MKSSDILTSLVLLVIIAGPLCASDFATDLISYSGAFGAVPYDDPYAVLGEPTTLIKRSDTDIFACSLVYSAWNTAPDGTKLVVTLDAGDEIVVGFDHKVSDDPANPFGIDFIVFGNTAFKTVLDNYIEPDTDMDQLLLANPTAILAEPVTVSVGQDPNGPWYTFNDGPFADELFPTNAFLWDSQLNSWSEQSDWLKPVDPNLSLADFSGISAADAIGLYARSGGGTGFDLKWLLPQNYQALLTDPISGRKWIQYIKVSSTNLGEVDAFADVAACGDYQHPYPIGDINQDCKVDIIDFAMLSEHWLECTWGCQ